MDQLQNEIRLLIKGKSSFSSKTVKKLGDLVDKYPYAPIFHFLYLRGLQEEDSYKFPSQLNRSSVSTMNRSALLDWAETPLIPIEIQIAAIEDSNQEKQMAVLRSQTSKNYHNLKEDNKKQKYPQRKIKTAQKKSSSSMGSDKVLDLTSLPEKVREQILRSRAIKAKYGSVENDDFSSTKSMESELLKTSDQLKFEKEIDLGSHETNLQDSRIKKKSKTVKDLKTIKSASKKSSDKYMDELSSFARFLNDLQLEEKKEDSLINEDRDTNKERAILEQFIELNPKISAPRNFGKSEDLTLKTPNVSGLVTETLANHYFEQGVFLKAIQAYEILKLKVPQKSSIFAARIAEMRNLQSEKK
jgi:hypothetical protein